MARNVEFDESCRENERVQFELFNFSETKQVLPPLCKAKFCDP